MDVEKTGAFHVHAIVFLRSHAQIPLDVPYAIRVESSVPIIVQYSRMDVTQPALTLMTTMAWPSE